MFEHGELYANSKTLQNLGSKQAKSKSINTPHLEWWLVRESIQIFYDGVFKSNLRPKTRRNGRRGRRKQCSERPIGGEMTMGREM